jgi:hypothetical protein
MLLSWYWTFRLYKMRGISWVAEQLLAFQEGLGVEWKWLSVRFCGELRYPSSSALGRLVNWYGKSQGSRLCSWELDGPHQGTRHTFLRGFDINGVEPFGSVVREMVSYGFHCWCQVPVAFMCLCHVTCHVASVGPRINNTDTWYRCGSSGLTSCPQTMQLQWMLTQMAPCHVIGRRLLL